MSSYLERRREMKLGDSQEKITKEYKKELDIYYREKSLTSPGVCEECNCGLQATINFHPRAHIAHIVDKSPTNGSMSVGANINNGWYACLTCHTKYDKEPDDVIAEMKIIPVLRERLKLFINEIPPHEMRRVPKFLLPANE